MKKHPAFILIFILFIAAAGGGQTAKQAAKRKAPPVQSLDLLLSRIDSYWKLLLQKRKAQAAQYITLSDRDNFLSVTIPPFSDSRFNSLELSADRREATTTVIVKRLLPPLAQAVEWPVIEQWRFEKGNWYRRFRGFSLPTSQTAGAEKLSPEQVEDVKQEIREKLRIENSVLDFGTVRESAEIKLSLKYTLTGNEPIAVTFKAPPGFAIQGMSNGALVPGVQRELLIGVPSWDHEGGMNEQIILTAHRRGVSVPFEFAVKGNIYVPVSITPKRFKLNKDMPEREIVVRNNSESDVELVRLHTETGRVIVEPLPTTVPAGQQLSMKVKLSGRGGTSPRDNLSIPLAQPVDGVAVLAFTVEFDPGEGMPMGDVDSKGINEPPIIQSDKTRSCPATPAD
jgi:hypothetical protein